MGPRVVPRQRPTPRRNWRLRDQVFLRDQGVCVDCPPGAPAYEWWQWHADHVIELADGGRDELDNAVTRCLMHHHAKSNAAKAARRKGRILDPTRLPDYTLPLTADRPR